MPKRIFIWVFTLISLTLSFEAFSKEKDVMPVYEISGAGTGTQGLYLINVTIISKEKAPSDNTIKRAAVHGVLFKGFSNPELRQSQKPLAGGAANEAQHIDFYKDFFSETGSAINYATIIDGSRMIIKSGKEYRVTVPVSVQKDALRSYLESLGVIKGLNSIF